MNMKKYGNLTARLKAAFTAVILSAGVFLLGSSVNVSAEGEKSGALKESVWSMAEDVAPVLKNNSSKKNMVFSPFSLYTALSLLSEGAENKSLEELRLFLKSDGKIDYRGEISKVNRIFSDMKTETDHTTMLNGIFIGEDFRIKEGFLEKGAKYGAEVKNVNFKNEERTRKFFEEWISNNTGGMLKFSPSFTRDSSLVILNVLNLKGRWEKAFEEMPEMDFVTSEGKTVKTKTMGKKDYKGNYFKGDGFEGYSEELKGAGTVYFILPHKGIQPEDLESIRNIGGIEGEKKNMDITMPEISIETKDLGIDTAMKKMGYEDIFSGGADFSGIAENLMVSSVRQTSKIVIGKEEIKGSSVTSIDMMPTAAPVQNENPIELTFDRPYLVIIENEGIPMFIVNVEDPSEK